MVDSGETGLDVLIVRPAIVNLDITAPEAGREAGMSETIAASAGQMTLYAELFDSTSSQLIGKVADPEADKGFGGQLMRQSGPSNKMAEDRIVRRWADALAGHIGQAVAAGR